MPYDSFPPTKLCEKCFTGKSIGINMKTIYIREDRKFKPLGLLCPFCGDIKYYEKGNKILQKFKEKELDKKGYRNREKLN
jgi:hypothetical protein